MSQHDGPASQGFGQFLVERGEVLAESLLADERPRPERIVLMGQAVSPRFYLQIIRLGVGLCVVGHGEDFDFLSVHLPSLIRSAALSLIRCDAERDPLDLRARDGVVVLRAVHHFKEPAETLARIFASLPDGSPLFILDTTSELEISHRREWALWEQTDEAEFLKKSQPQLRGLLERKAIEEQKCLGLLDGHGLTDERAARRLLLSAGIRSEQFEYDPKCICAPFGWCGHYSNYWFAVVYGK